MLNNLILKYWQKVSHFNIKLGLEQTSALLNKLNNPQNSQNIVHIAGTNGKGSTIVTLEYLLINSGYKVATTISPHLINVNERFRFQSKTISNNELNELFKIFFDICKINNKNIDNSNSWKFKPSYFETIIVLFLLWAKQKETDFTLLETGLGGRLDATNVVTPILTAITRISFDHQKILGDSLEQITYEKLAILKDKIPCVIARQNKEVNRIISNYNKFSGKLYRFGIDYGIKEINDNIGKVFYSKIKNTVKYDIKKLALLGEYQWDNSATALAMYQILVSEDKKLVESKINTSLQNVKWHGRIQYIKTTPNLLVDAAHNNEGIESLLKYLIKTHKYKNILISLCWMKDKEITINSSLINQLNLDFLPIIFKNNRAEKTIKIKNNIESMGINTLSVIDLNQCIKNIINKIYFKYDLIVISGSIYLIGEMLKKLLSYKVIKLP